MSDTVGIFNVTLAKLIDKLSDKSRTLEERVNLAQLNTRLTLIRATCDRNTVLIHCCPAFMLYADNIVEPDEAKREQFFLSIDLEKLFKERGRTIGSDERLAIDIFKSVKSHWRAAPKKERDEVYDHIKTLLRCCLEYKLEEHH
jgi:hypothetical protein